MVEGKYASTFKLIYENKGRVGRLIEIVLGKFKDLLRSSTTLLENGDPASMLGVF